ncbi:membrane integrity-associated transporter subunit PqiC [Campylobacter sp. RM10543]|uniref:ABC-type transport auxiliary lipoprotein family protein n=1 Tax=Campylobacter molothri TaxID=1032242 RepID=UPI00301BB672|nr:membrane integrity-associated transporter subunit PqiC [Campylobacter sp. RM10543]
MKKYLYILILSFIFYGCSINNQIDKTQMFILKNDEISSNISFKKTNKILKIKNAYLPLYLNSKSIIYTKNNISNTYAYHFWADLPSNFYKSFLLSKLEKTKIFKAVISSQSSLNADYVLESRIDSFEQIIDLKQNYTQITVSVNLIDAKKNEIIAHQFFNCKENINQNNISNIYQSFEKNLNSLTKDIILWINSNID